MSSRQPIVPKKTTTTKVVAEKTEKNNSKSDETIKGNLRKVEWKELTPIGFEFSTWESMKNEPWSFKELNQELSEGFLSKTDYPLYIFMGAQPIVENKVAMNMPYIVVFDCKSPPPNKMAKTSIQSGTEEILDLKTLGLAWAPYIKSKYQTIDRKKIPYQIYTLNMNERPGKAISQDKALALQYVLPYIRIPSIVDKITEPPLVVTVSFYRNVKIEKSFVEAENKERLEKEEAEIKEAQKKAEDEGKKYRGPMKPKFKPQKPSKDGNYYRMIEFSYNKDVDTVADFTEEIIEEYHLDETPETIKGFLKEEFDLKRAKVAKEFKEMKDEVQAWTPEQRSHYENAKIFKFYPSHPTIQVQPYASSRINRYWGNATETFPKEIKKDLTKLKEVTDMDAYKKKIDQEYLHKGEVKEDKKEEEEQEEQEEEKEEEKVIKKPKEAPAKKKAGRPASKTTTGKRKQMEPEAEAEAEQQKKEEEEEKVEDKEEPEKDEDASKAIKKHKSTK